jgi:hypothetical protein
MQEHQLQIVTPTQTFSKAADNTLLMYMEFGMAHKFIEDLSRNVIRGLQTKAEQGWRPSPAKVGYLNNSFKEKGKKDIAADPERFPLVRQMWDLLLTGCCTVPHIIDIATNEWGFRTRATKKTGGGPLAVSTLYEVFTDPFYYGWFEYPRGSGRWYQGKHPPMITEAEFDQAQMILGRKGKPRPKRHVFAFTGLIRCGECGNMVTAEAKQQIRCSSCRFKFSCQHQERCPRCQIAIDDMAAPTRRQYIYYRCTKKNSPNCRQGAVTVENLEAQILDRLTQIDLSDRSHRWAMTALDDVCAEKLKEITPIQDTRRRGADDYQQQLDNLTRLYTSPRNADRSLLSDEEYERQRFAFLKEKSTLAHGPVSERDQLLRHIESVRKAFNVAREVREQFTSGGAKKKREILASVGSNFLLNGKKLGFEPLLPFRVIEDSLLQLRRLEPAIEPPSGGSNAGQFAYPATAIPIWSGKSDDVRTYKRKWRALVLKLLDSLAAEDTISSQRIAA